MEDNGDAVVGSNGANVHGKGDRSSGTGVLVFDGFSGHELSAAVGDLDHDGGVEFGTGFQYCVGGGGTVAMNERTDKIGSDCDLYLYSRRQTIPLFH